jgi:hypothetical protein
MLKTRLLQAVCTVAMLAAVPAFAQSNTPGSVAPPGADNKAGMAPADNTGAGGPAADDSHATHRSARGHRSGAMHSGKSATSQDAAVDRLNEQSYQAAQKGEAFGRGRIRPGVVGYDETERIGKYGRYAGWSDAGRWCGRPTQAVGVRRESGVSGGAAFRHGSAAAQQRHDGGVQTEQAERRRFAIEPSAKVAPSSVTVVSAVAGGNPQIDKPASTSVARETD